MNHFRFPFRALLGVLAAGLMVAPAVGQDQSFAPAGGGGAGEQASKQPTKSKDKLKEEGKEVFGPGKARPGSVETASSWSIVIAAFRGDDQDAQAAAGLERVRSDGGLKEAYLEKRGQAAVIAYGRYQDPASKQAKADLERIKGIEVVVNGGKQHPFAQAFITPPEDVPGSLPEFDLRNARKLSGEWVLYSLQIGVYSREDGKEATAAERAEFRKAAEQAVVQLRREGDPAYYFHGPRRSMVTVGLFGKDDFDPQTPGVESATLKALRSRYPYNLNNGMGTRRRVQWVNPQSGAVAKKEKIEQSALVNVPRE
jgi:hypothetical protein